jgi:hypothetical protein
MIKSNSVIARCFRCDVAMVPTFDNRCPACQFKLDFKSIIEPINVTDEDQFDKSKPKREWRYHRTLPGVRFSTYLWIIIYIIFAPIRLILGLLLSLLILFIFFFGGIFLPDLFKMNLRSTIEDSLSFLYSPYIFQTERNRVAKEILHQIHCREDVLLPFVLYLRPFYLEKALKVLDKGQGNYFKYFISGDTNDLYSDFEKILQKSISNYFAFVGMGKSGDDLGAGRIETAPDIWKNEIKLLIKECSFVIVIPSYCEGTRLEIEYLKASCQISKTIFVMPPSHLNSTEIEKEWNKTVSVYKLLNTGIHLPIYHRGGMLFTLGISGRIQKTKRPNFKSKSSLRIAITEILSDEQIFL